MRSTSRIVLVAIGVAVAAAVGATARAESQVTIEISGPILPKTSVLYGQEGANFPTTTQGEETLVADAALTFGQLLVSCQATHPSITLEADGGAPLDATQLATNYAEVADCAYKEYTSKPYWIPQLVDDVDICAKELGAGFRLPTEQDLADLTDVESQHLADTLTAAAAGHAFAAFYFSLSIFVRGADGTIKKGDLSPGAVRVVPLTASGADLKKHYEGGLALRCVRQT